MAGNQEVLQLLINLKEADNTKRNQAEALLKELRASQSQALFSSLHQIITASTPDA